jgi:uncharacterized phage protein gp47/JayE
MPNLNTFVIKTAEEIRDDYLRTVKEGLINLGIPNPNVSEGTLDYLRGTALGEFGGLIYQMIQIKSDAQMPDTAQGDDLIRIAKIYNLDLRAAGGSSGTIILDASVAVPILIPTGAQLVDPSGLSYKVSIGGPYSNDDEIPIEAIDTGSNTNLATGTTLKWVSPPPFVNKTTVVSIGGLTGGVDAETFEGLRTRILEKLRNPPGGGNFSQLNEAAENSTVAVQKSFCYPAANGPATVHVAVTTAPTETNKERDLDITTLNTKVSPTVQSVVPQYFELLVTTVQNQQVDAAIGLSIPSALTASPPGAGGGWVDGKPFPIKVSAGRSQVTAITNTTTFTIDCDLNPAIGDSICWISPQDWSLNRAIVLSFSGSAPSVTITIDTPFVGIAVGNFIFPDAENMDDYVVTLLNMFANLGPGQKTTSPGLLPRAYRRPLVSESWASDLNLQTLSILSDTHEEINVALYLYAPVTSPSIPSSITDGPFILIPRNLAFYPIS